MHSSHTLSQVTYQVHLLENAFRRWDIAASLAEKITRMEELTFMLLSTSATNDDLDDLMFSMWQAATRILALLKGHRLRVGSMLLRMETLYGPDWRDLDRPEIEIATLLLNGLRSRLQAIDNRFGILFTNWIPKVRHVLSPNFQNTVTGSSLLTLPTMNTPDPSHSLLENLTAEINGYYNLESDWEDLP